MTDTTNEEATRPVSVHCPLCGEFVEDIGCSTQHRQHRIQCVTCGRYFTVEFHRGGTNMPSALAYTFVIGKE